MKIIFKVIFLLLLWIFCNQIIFANNLKIEKFATPIKIPNKISQPINLSFATDGNWKLLAEPLDNQIRNIDNPNYTLPITRLEVAEMGGAPISHFDIGKSYEIRNGNSLGVNNMNLALNVVNFDCDYPGNYITDIKFTLMNNNSVVAEEIYTFRFMQDTISSIDFSQRIVNLSIDKNKILQRNSAQNLANPLGLYICSNKNWKLYMRSTSNNNDKSLKYFVKVLGGTDSTLTYNQTNEYIPLQNTPIFLASGKSTINQMANTLEKKLLNIDYMVKGPEDNFIPAGSRSEEFEYRLETED